MLSRNPSMASWCSSSSMHSCVTFPIHSRSNYFTKNNTTMWDASGTHFLGRLLARFRECHMHSCDWQCHSRNKTKSCTVVSFWVTWVDLKGEIFAIHPTFLRIIVTWLGWDDQDVQFEIVATFFIIFKARMSISFIIKVKIFFLL